MMDRSEGLGWIFVIFGASLMAQVIGVIIDCANITCTPLSGLVTILLSAISMLSIIFGVDKITD